MPEHVVHRVVETVRSDLETGVWEERYGELRHLKEYDVGVRVVIASPTANEVT